MEPRETLDKSTIRRGWLLILVIMVAFIALTKIFPSPAHGPAPAQQITDLAKPSP